MLVEDKVIVMDLDGTLCEIKLPDQSYLDVKPKAEVVNKLLEYKKNDFYIILYTSRQMRTHQGNLGKINASTAKDIFTWLDYHHIPYDEIYFGKPWCGRNGFYVDDKAIRPDEFLKLSYQQIIEKLR